MEKIRVIHWNQEEARERAERLRASGYVVDVELPAPPQLLRQLADDPPAALIIDLGRLPSQGRDLAVSIRMRQATRYLPLVFVGGLPDKVARVKELLPDAFYTSWEEIGTTLGKALAAPPTEAIVPDSVFAPYAGKPLVEKLGIKKGSVVGLVDAPPVFGQTLGQLPPGASLRLGADSQCNLTIWFSRSADDLQRLIPEIVAWAEYGSAWIAWPKKASGIATDLTQQRVREAGLVAGLVDYKICAIDKTWSGLLFTQRKSD